MDLIDKKPLIRHLRNWQLEQFAEVGHEREYNMLDSIIRGIENEPTIDAVPVVHGEWEEICNAYGELEGWIHVDCGREVKCAENFCPNCGADMRKGGSNE